MDKDEFYRRAFLAAFQAKLNQSPSNLTADEYEMLIELADSLARLAVQKCY